MASASDLWQQSPLSRALAFVLLHHNVKAAVFCAPALG